MRHLRDLLAGRPIDVPVYDYASYTRTGATERLDPAPFVVIEGLLVLYWKDLRDLCRTTVYVDAADELCLERRKRRDVVERQRTVESVTRQYNETVRPMAEQYVWPTKAFAGLIVSGTAPLERCAEEVLLHISRTSQAQAPTATMR